MVKWMEKKIRKQKAKIQNDEPTSFVNGSLITDQWFDSSRQKHTDRQHQHKSIAAESERFASHDVKIIIANEAYNEAKQTNKQYDYIKLTKAAMWSREMKKLAFIWK